MVQDLKENIKTLRALKGFDQAYMANRMGISRSSYSQLENGHYRLTAAHLINISEILGVKVQDIIDFEKEMFSKNELNARGSIEKSGDVTDQKQVEMYKDVIALQRELISELKQELLALKGL